MPDVLMRIELGNRVNRPPLVCVICGETATQLNEYTSAGIKVPVPFCHVHADYWAPPAGLFLLPAVVMLPVAVCIFKLGSNPSVTLPIAVLVGGIGLLLSFALGYLFGRRFRVDAVVQHNASKPTHICLRFVCPGFAEAFEKHQDSSNPFTGSDAESGNPFQF